MLSHPHACLVDEILDSCQRIALGVGQNTAQLALEVLAVLGKDRLAKSLLTLEVVIERALGYMDTLEHHVDTGGLESLLGQYIRRVYGNWKNPRWIPESRFFMNMRSSRSSRFSSFIW